MPHEGPGRAGAGQDPPIGADAGPEGDEHAILAAEDRGPFLQATAGNADHARPFSYFILEDDLRSKPLNYVFAETYGGPYNLSVVSVARLAPDGIR